ncbi:hypothetical protein BS47DRAFT_1486603 [Hydnum rufescens UP504]|uniref:PPIase cyclophilin-type domain-containing protein n=1 Tax=Hydnum rufescens UP504 TaxID=1448309 RepID=A0A9P6AU44_9AGAM|nr:hypothetical protein BS47DRAFT_1486603 [Hydnum rufescens UP504]
MLPLRTLIPTFELHSILPYIQLSLLLVFSNCIMPAYSRLVYLDIAVNGIGQGRLEIELYPTSDGDMASHFLAICANYLNFNYTGTRFFCVIPGEALWGGTLGTMVQETMLAFPPECNPRILPCAWLVLAI